MFLTTLILRARFPSMCLFIIQCFFECWINIVVDSKFIFAFPSNYKVLICIEFFWFCFPFEIDHLKASLSIARVTSDDRLEVVVLLVDRGVVYFVEVLGIILLAILAYPENCDKIPRVSLGELRVSHVLILWLREYLLVVTVISFILDLVIDNVQANPSLCERISEEFTHCLSKRWLDEIPNKVKVIDSIYFPAKTNWCRLDNLTFIHLHQVWNASKLAWVFHYSNKPSENIIVISKTTFVWIGGWLSQVIISYLSKNSLVFGILIS